MFLILMESPDLGLSSGSKFWFSWGYKLTWKLTYSVPLRVCTPQMGPSDNSKIVPNGIEEVTSKEFKFLLLTMMHHPLLLKTLGLCSICKDNRSVFYGD